MNKLGEKIGRINSKIGKNRIIIVLGSVDYAPELSYMIVNSNFNNKLCYK